MTDYEHVPGMLREKKYAEAVALVRDGEVNKYFIEQAHRAIAMVLPHAGKEAKKLYARVKNSPYPFVHYHLAEYDAKHAARFVELAPMGAAMVDKKFGTKARAERAKFDPSDHLSALFEDAEAMESLFMHFTSACKRDPGPMRRNKPLGAAKQLRALWGKLPDALEAWIEILDHWDLGFHELGRWQAWNEGLSHRSWNPPHAPPANANAIEWLLKLAASRGRTDERAKDGTLDLVFASCVPIGRVEFTRAELGVFLGDPPEVLEIDREKDVCRIVAPSFDAFVGSTRRREWKPKAVKAKSRAVHAATRAGWIVDMLIDAQPMPAVVKAFKKYGEKKPVIDQIELPGDALYWLFHCYFTDAQEQLEYLLVKLRDHEAKLVRDAVTLVKKNKLATKRASFLMRL